MPDACSLCILNLTCPPAGAGSARLHSRHGDGPVHQRARPTVLRRTGRGQGPAGRPRKTTSRSGRPSSRRKACKESTNASQKTAARAAPSLSEIPTTPTTWPRSNPWGAARTALWAVTTQVKAFAACPSTWGSTATEAKSICSASRQPPGLTAATSRRSAVTARSVTPAAAARMDEVERVLRQVGHPPIPTSLTERAPKLATAASSVLEAAASAAQRSQRARPDRQHHDQPTTR